MDEQTGSEPPMETAPKPVVRKRTIAAFIAFVVLSAGVHFTIGPAMTAMTPRWDYGMLPKQAVAIVTLSRLREEVVPKPTPSPTPTPMPLPKTHRDIALIKDLELGATDDRRSRVRPISRRTPKIEIDRYEPLKVHADSPPADLVVAHAVPTPEASSPPGDAKSATGDVGLQSSSVWGDDNPPRLIKRAPLAIADTATAAARVEVDIAPDGTVVDVRLLQSSGVAEVDQAALDAARASAYAPATLNGLPVHGTCTVEYAPDSASTT